jgi:hypothetical protein
MRAVTDRALAVMLMSFSTWREPNHAFTPEVSKAAAVSDEEAVTAVSRSSGPGRLATANLPHTREPGVVTPMAAEHSYRSDAVNNRIPAGALENPAGKR